MSIERDYVTAHRDELLADLDEWLRIPGISAQPVHHPDVARSAEWFANAARAAGFPTVEIWPTDGLPAVYAEWPSDDAAAPTVLVYGHHDVQPVDPLELWRTDPFDPTIDGDLLRARGASDDKGQLLFHLLGLRAHLAATGRTTSGRHAEVPDRGRGGVRLAELRGAARTAAGSVGLRRRGGHRHRHDRAGQAVHGHRHARAGRLPRRLPRAGPRSALGPVRRCGARTRPRSPCASPARCTTTTAVCSSPASTTTCSS